MPHLEILFAFGAYCYYIRHNTANTVQQKLSAIQALWYFNGFRGESFLKHTKYKLFIRGLLQLQGGPTSDTRQPCTAKGLVTTFARLNRRNREQLMAITWMSVAYAGSFRVSEWTAIKWKHLFWYRDSLGHVVKIFLPHEKSLLFRESRYVEIVNVNNINAADLLADWWKFNSSVGWEDWLTHHGNDFIFSFTGSSKLRYADFNPFLRFYAKVNNVDPLLIKGHSLRIGATTDMARRGATDKIIESLGRWHSDAHRTYSRQDDIAKRENRRRFLGF